MIAFMKIKHAPLRGSILAVTHSSMMRSPTQGFFHYILFFDTRQEERFSVNSWGREERNQLCRGGNLGTILLRVCEKNPVSEIIKVTHAETNSF